jgi:hypothetical protein
MWTPYLNPLSKEGTSVAVYRAQNGGQSNGVEHSYGFQPVLLLSFLWALCSVPISDTHQDSLQGLDIIWRTNTSQLLGNRFYVNDGTETTKQVSNSECYTPSPESFRFYELRQVKYRH